MFTATLAHPIRTSVAREIKFSLRARLRSDWTLFALVELVEARGGKKTRVTEVKESKSAEYEIDRSEHGLRI